MSTDRATIVVSTTDATKDPADRQTLGPDPNFATLTVIVRGLNTGETVQVVLEATDPRGLFVPPVGNPDVGRVEFNVTDNQSPDADNTAGTIRVTAEYYSSRKAQAVTIRATVYRNNQLYGESAVAIFQKPGPVEKAFFAVDPPRLAVSTVTGEPTQARLIASIYDANDNPVPNERVSFAIVDSEVIPYEDLLAGDGFHIALTRYDIPSRSERFRAQGGSTAATNDWGPGGVPRVDRYQGFLGFSPDPFNWTGPTVWDPYFPAAGHPLTNHFYRLYLPSSAPAVADGAIGPQSEVYTDVNGVAITYLTSVNVCQPVTVRMVPQSNPTLQRTYSTFYYVPVDRVDVFITSGDLITGPGGTFTVEFRFSPASALPPGTRVWVRIHGTAYDGDEDDDGLVNEDPTGRNNWDDDKDGRIDEDPAGDANGDDDDDDDFDGNDDEDPGGTQNSDDDGDGRTDEDWNPGIVDYFTTVTVTEPGVVRVSINNSSSSPDWANGWKVIQVFVWNRDGLRLMGQTSPITFP